MLKTGLWAQRREGRRSGIRIRLKPSVLQGQPLPGVRPRSLLLRPRGKVRDEAARTSQKPLPPLPAAQHAGHPGRVPLPHGDSVSRGGGWSGRARDQGGKCDRQSATALCGPAGPGSVHRETQTPGAHRQPQETRAAEGTEPPPRLGVCLTPFSQEGPSLRATVEEAGWCGVPPELELLTPTSEYPAYKSEVPQSPGRWARVCQDKLWGALVLPGPRPPPSNPVLC